MARTAHPAPACQHLGQPPIIMCELTSDLTPGRANNNRFAVDLDKPLASEIVIYAYIEPITDCCNGFRHTDGVCRKQNRQNRKQKTKCLKEPIIISWSNVSLPMGRKHILLCSSSQHFYYRRGAIAHSTECWT